MLRNKIFYLVSGVILITACNKNRLLVETKELNQNWEFRQNECDVWNRATVPGCVHTDLISAGIINDPFFRLNEDSVQWVGKKDWVYRTTFNIDEPDLCNQAINLVFEGLDTHASVTLNGEEILNADNMFLKWEVPVKKYLKTGTNKIEIYFKSAEGYNTEKASEIQYKLPEDERVHSRKAPYQFGWDWGPRLITAGIWRPVYLQLWNNSRIDNIFFSAKNISTEKAVYNAQIEIEALQSGSAEIVLSATEKNIKTRRKKVELKEGLNTMNMEFDIVNPELWWPNGMGKPNLYNINISLFTQGGFHTLNEKIGVRTIELKQIDDEQGKSFEFHVNGIPVFSKGANYIPLESFPSRLTAHDYKNAINDAVKANFNMLRVWGGGIYENKIFYNLCDENGIMVWQDFMFACAMYPGDEPFLNNVKKEITHNVKRLRNHPSLVLWCGNNEIRNGWYDWGWQKSLGYSAKDSLEVWGNYEKIFHKIIPDVLAKEDPTRQYWPSSPLYGWGHKESTTTGDNHYWGVWWGKEPFEMYQKKVSRFMSEFGFQSFPSWETILTFTNPEDRHLWSPVMRKHQKHPTGNETINEYLKRWYPEPKDFESYVYVSQVLQAEGVLIGIAAHRQAMPYSMGTLYWQFNDCWPAASWSSRDYYGNWKAMHYYARKAYSNLFISSKEENGNLNIYITSDLTEISNNQIVITLYDFNGIEIYSFKNDIEVKPGSQIVFKRNIESITGNQSLKNCVVKTELLNNKKIIADNYFYFDKVRNLDLKPVNIKTNVLKTENGYEVTFSSDYLAKSVFVSLPGITGWWSDNFFDIIPGNFKKVHFETGGEISDITDRIKIISMADAF